tara:strand:+ start:1704 stop:1895 length:192 start_codon:yes stop_codon:yes gene_type:complete
LRGAPLGGPQAHLVILEALHVLLLLRLQRAMEAVVVDVVIVVTSGHLYPPTANLESKFWPGSA